MPKSPDREYPSDAVLMEAGIACVDWAEDSGECHFCNRDNTGPERIHEDWCPLSIRVNQ